MFITNNQSSFNLWSNEKLVKYKKFSKYYVHHCLQNFPLLSMSSLTVSFVKNSDFLAGMYFVFLKKRPGPNVKVFRYQILTLAKRLEKVLSSKAKFSTFLQHNCSNFRIKTALKAL